MLVAYKFLLFVRRKLTCPLIYMLYRTIPILSASVRTDHKTTHLSQNINLFNRKHILQRVWLHNSRVTSCTQASMIVSQFTSHSRTSDT